MKKIIYLFGVLVAGSLFLQAEEINAVYFNPSRLGAFDTLRVTNSLNTAADLEVASIDIDATGGTVSLQAREAMSDHELSHFYFDKPSTVGWAGIQAQQGKINMPGTTFSLSTIQISGPGKASFTGTDSGVKSTIYQLGASSPASALEIGGDMKTGTFSATSSEIRVAGNFTLGGNTIPRPSCTMGWISRVDESGKTHSILGCTTSSYPGSNCSWTISNWTVEGMGCAGGGGWFTCSAAHEPDSGSLNSSADFLTIEAEFKSKAATEGPNSCSLHICKYTGSSAGQTTLYAATAICTSN